MTDEREVFEIDYKLDQPDCSHCGCTYHCRRLYWNNLCTWFWLIDLGMQRANPSIALSFDSICKDNNLWTCEPWRDGIAHMMHSNPSSRNSLQKFVAGLSSIPKVAIVSFLNRCVRRLSIFMKKVISLQKCCWKPWTPCTIIVRENVDRHVEIEPFDV